jgi:hypothetical protein
MALTTITNSMVSVNAIQGTLIADNAITAVHIATNAVSGTLIADNAITATHIAQNIITVTQLADDAVEGAKIADSVITTNHLNKAMISSQTEVSAVAGDYVLLGDTSDSNNLKKAPISSILAGTLTTAAQTNITSVGTLSSLAVGAITSTAASTITTADNLAQLTLISTDADANVGPVLKLFRNSGSPADDDAIGRIQWSADDDAGNDSTFARINVVATDVSNGSEDARMEFAPAVADSFTPTMSLTGGNVGIGGNDPKQALEIIRNSSSGSAGGYAGLSLRNDHSSGLMAVQFHEGQTNVCDILVQNGVDDMQFRMGGSEKMRITSSGNVGIGTDDPAAALEVSRGSAGYAGIFGAPQGSGRVILFKDNHASPNKYNWLVGSQYTINHGFEITPSTAIGGTTFSNPAISILYTGNVGIGTESPTMPLSVQAASNAYAISMHGRSDGYSELYGASNDGSTKYSFLQSHSAQTKLYTLVNTPLLFGTNSTERMRLSAAGDLQLESGAANKGYIQLSTQATSYALMGGNHWGYMGYKTGGYHRWFGSDGAEDMRIDSSGKVLIGDNASHTTDLLQIETPASGGGHGIQIRRNDANSDQVIGHVMFGNNTATDLAKISAKTDGDSNSGDSGALAFHTQVTGGALTERLRLTSTGEVWCPEKGNNGDYTMYIGSCNAVSNGNSYLHVNLDMPGSDMFWIEVIGYDYVAKSIYGRAGGYMYNFTNQTSVYSGVYNGDIDAAYMNTNGDLELAIATGYSGTSNRWGSVVLRGGHDTISATGPIKIKEYSYTANTDQVYQV